MRKPLVMDVGYLVMRKPIVMDVGYLPGAKMVSKDFSFSQCILNVNGGKLPLSFPPETYISRLLMSEFHKTLDYNCKAHLNVLLNIMFVSSQINRFAFKKHFNQ